jgi:hypothetical protein
MSDQITEARFAAHEISMKDAEARYVLDVLSKKLLSNIQKHIQAMDLAFNQKQIFYPGLGNLEYVQKSIYVKNLAETDGDANFQSILPYDKAISYQFFMFRAITSDKKFELPAKHIITFDKTSDHMYSQLDVLQSFNYQDTNLNMIQSHTGPKVNKDAVMLLKEEKLELVKIIKDVFEDYQIQCNSLKHIDPTYKNQIVQQVCSTKYDSTDIDFFLNYATCREIFTLASLDEFCPDLDLGHGYFDEL